MSVIFKNKSMEVEIDERFGTVCRIVKNDDEANMDWVLPGSQWGRVENFKTASVSVRENEVFVEAVCERAPLSLQVCRKIEEDAYTERYTFTNTSREALEIDQETFGICFPFNCAIEIAEDFIKKICVAHVWCGGNTAWLYGEKLDGGAPYLIVQMTEGDCSDYSISKDIVGRKMVDYRGEILLNPTPCRLQGGESLCMAFEHRFSEEPPKIALAKRQDFIGAYADAYSVLRGENVTVSVECAGGLNDPSFAKTGPWRLKRTGRRQKPCVNSTPSVRKRFAYSQTESILSFS